MNDHVEIQGVPPYDGKWDLGEAPFNNLEYHTIKRLSGLRANEINEAFAAGDMDLVLALAAIALARNNQHVDEPTLWNAEGGSIRFIAGDDAVPPQQAASEPDGKQASSGAGSATDSENPETDPSPTGQESSSELSLQRT